MFSPDVSSLAKLSPGLKKCQVSTSQVTAADGDVKVLLEAHCVCHSKESVQSIEVCFLHVAYQ